jgi:hypothetical protein
MAVAEELLHDSWVMYFHEPSDANWTNESYVRLADMSSVEDFWRVCDGVRKTLPAAMLFVMRTDVFPTWDDPANLKGGCLSFRVSRDDMGAAWEELVARLLGETLLARPGDAEDYARVNGISTSPKRFFCIVKIWLRDDKFSTRDDFVLPTCMLHGEALFRSNLDNIKHNNETTLSGKNFARGGAA